MKANREYRLLHTRGGLAPSRLADPQRYRAERIIALAQWFLSQVPPV